MNEFLYWDDPGDSQATVDRQEKKHLVAVYGTLKVGKSNNIYLRDSVYMGTAKTKDPMRMCVISLPYMIRGSHDEGKNVMLDVYYVDDTTLAALDRLEGHPVYYRREKIALTPDQSMFNSDFDAWVYMVGEEYDNNKYYDEF